MFLEKVVKLQNGEDVTKVQIVQRAQNITEVFQMQCIDRVVRESVVLQRRIPAVQEVQKRILVPQIRYNEREMSILGVEQRSVSTDQCAKKSGKTKSDKDRDVAEKCEQDADVLSVNAEWGVPCQVTRICTWSPARPQCCFKVSACLGSASLVVVSQSRSSGPKPLDCVVQDP